MAKIFLSNTDTTYTVGNSNVLVYGDSTNHNQKIILTADVNAITLDANTDGLQLSGNQTDYSFQQAGNSLNVLKGGVLVSQVGIQDDADGSQFVFADKTIAAKPIFDAAKGGLYFDVGGVEVHANSNVSTVIDNVAPIITSLNPTDNSLNVLVGANLQIVFNEPIKVGSSYIVINGADARVISVTDTKQISINGNTLTINPTADLKTNSFYSVQVAKGAITDLAGNQFAGITDDQAFNFKTDVGLALTGKAIDGYLKGATVSMTANGKTYTTTTDDKGNFSFPAGTPQGALTTSGGIDLSTGKAFKGVLKAPEGSTVITPLTTLVQGFVEKGKSPEDAQKAVGKALGLDLSKIDLSKHDPIQATVNSKGGSVEDKDFAGKMMAATAKMANFIVMGSETLKGAVKGDVDLDKITDSLISSLLDKMENNADAKGEIDLGGSAFLQGVFSDSAKFGGGIEFDLDKMTNISDNFGSMMADFSGKMDASFNHDADPLTFLSDLGKILSYAQNDATAQLAEFAASGANFDDLMNGFMGDSAKGFIDSIALGGDFLSGFDLLGDDYKDFNFTDLGLGGINPNKLPEDGILPPLTEKEIQESGDNDGDGDNAPPYVPPVVITGTTSLNQGTLKVPVALTATANGKYSIDTVHNDSVQLPAANVKITGFGSGNQLIFNVSDISDDAHSLVEVNHLYGVSDNTHDLKLIANVAGSVQSITLVGLADHSTYPVSVGKNIDNITELNTLLTSIGSSIDFI